MLPPLKPIPMKERVSVLYVEKGNLDVLDGAFVVVDKNGVRTHIPVGGVACLMLEIGTRISHAAVRLAAQVGTLLVWIGEGGVRLYSAGQPGGARADRLLYAFPAHAGMNRALGRPDRAPPARPPAPGRPRSGRRRLIDPVVLAAAL